ncbi:MAG: hypothetical protein GXO32_08110 [Crenarchaeota archaeon]|nr:hypothetical protein [Thermoproteota archaeon]
MVLRCGAARIDITPPPGLPMAGYLERKGLAVGAHDPLFARALYLDDGRTELLLLVLDLIRVEGMLLEEVRRSVSSATGIRDVFVAATHTHAGPEVSLSMWATQDISLKRSDIGRYIRFVATRCASAALEAMERAEASELRVSRGLVKEVATNRIDPRRPVDEEVALASVWSRGRLVAIVANFACHPTILGAINTLYSGDFFGFAAQEVEEALGGVAMICNGAAGNVSTRFSRMGYGFDEVARMGRKLSSAIVSSVISRGCRVNCVGCLDITYLRKSLRSRSLPRKDELEEMKSRVVSEIESARRSNVPKGVLRALLSKLYAIEVLLKRLAEGVPSTVDVELGVVRIGDRILAIFFPGELFVEYQLEAKRRAREKGKEVIVVGYSNGYLGYFPHKSYENIQCYETMVSIVDPSEYPRVEEMLLEALS